MVCRPAWNGLFYQGNSLVMMALVVRAGVAVHAEVNVLIANPEMAKGLDIDLLAAITLNNSIRRIGKAMVPLPADGTMDCCFGQSTTRNRSLWALKNNHPGWRRARSGLDVDHPGLGARRGLKA